MMYQCGRCGLTRASSQEPMGLAMPQCKCPFEFLPPVASAAPQRTWVEIDGDDWIKALEMADFDKVAAFEFFEAKLKELNT